MSNTQNTPKEFLPTATQQTHLPQLSQAAKPTTTAARRKRNMKDEDEDGTPVLLRRSTRARAPLELFSGLLLISSHFSSPLYTYKKCSIIKDRAHNNLNRASCGLERGRVEGRSGKRKRRIALRQAKHPQVYDASRRSLCPPSPPFLPLFLSLSLPPSLYLCVCVCVCVFLYMDK